LEQQPSEAIASYHIDQQEMNGAHDEIVRLQDITVGVSQDFHVRIFCFIVTWNIFNDTGTEPFVYSSLEQVDNKTDDLAEQKHHFRESVILNVIKRDSIFLPEMVISFIVGIIQAVILILIFIGLLNECVELVIISSIH
jgi:hypothetical protein